jgi:hypothetical protein
MSEDSVYGSPHALGQQKFLVEETCDVLQQAIYHFWQTENRM